LKNTFYVSPEDDVERGEHKSFNRHLTVGKQNPGQQLIPISRERLTNSLQHTLERPVEPFQTSVALRMVGRCFDLRHLALKQKNWVNSLINSLPQSDSISSGNPNIVNTLIRQRTTSAAVCVLIGKASGKWLAKSMTVKMNLLPDTVHGVNGPTISTAILEKILPMTGRLTKGALLGEAPFPRRWQTSQLRQNALTALPTPTQ